MNFKSLFFFLVLVVAAYGVCELPASVGPCRGYFERWFYSGGACKLFGYSGCGGNDNNFETRESCERNCLNSTNEPEDTEMVFDDEVNSDGIEKTNGDVLKGAGL